jgi:hypothetical protein
MAMLLGFVIAVAVSLLNGGDLLGSVLSGLVLAVIVGVIVAVLSWAVDTARTKGYGAWVGVLLVILLNLVGVVLLLLLPARQGSAARPMTR